MLFVLWVIAVVLVLVGIYKLLAQRDVWGFAWILVGLLVGPGGVSIFT